jgi:hypothetical protein
MDLAANLGRRVNAPMTFVVFGLCLAFTLLGIGISAYVFPPTVIKGGQFYALLIVIAFVVMGVTYGAKFNNAATRNTFTPVDIIQYTIAGFLWPAAWPALAEKAGQVIIQPAPEASPAALINLLGLLS